MKKRLITGVTLLVVMLIAATTIVLGFVQTNNKPELSAPTEITFHLTTGQSRTVTNVDGASEREKELYNSLYDAYNEMFNFSILTGIFTGSLGDYKLQEFSDQSQLSGSKITFSYLQKQTLTVKGEPYYSTFAKSKKYEYKTVEFIVVEDDALSDLKIVVYLDDQINGVRFYAEITTKANTSKIYNVIKDFYNI